MEQITNICLFLCGLSGLIAPLALIAWIVMRIKKSEKKKKAKIFFLCNLAVFVLSTAVGAATLCEHEWETIEKTKPTCTESGTAVLHCSLCDTERDDEELPPTGHTWVETRKEATCAEEGEIVKECLICNSKTIEKLVAQHNYTETIVTKPKCNADGTAQLVCSGCGEKQEKPIPATGHTMSSATCTQPKTCSACGATDGDPLGHTTAFGLCTRCHEAIQKQSPVTVVGMRWTMDYVGGVEWTFKIRNNTDKEIKYITFQWTCYNAVGDSIRDEISMKNYVRLKYTGPLAPGETTDSKRNTTLFYNHSYANLKWNEITVEYMDGTTESITEYHYGYYEQ